MGYPAPVLVNWNKTSKNPTGKWRANGTHIAKITGTLEHIKKIGEGNENDIILVVDGYDTWFQLPPSVLMSRYHKTNLESLKTIKATLGSKAVVTETIKQSVIFPAEKNCGPGESLRGEPACWAVPDSPLRSDLYGAGTDVLVSGNLSVNMRPKWLNAGLMMGPALDMLTMFEAAERLIDIVDHHGSDQLIFVKLFGEQSFQREVMRLRYQTTFRRWISRLMGRRSVIEPDAMHPDRESMDWLEGHPLDFGIGLDYSLAISQTAVWSEFDGRFLVHDSSKSLRRQQADSGVAARPFRVSGPLPKDIFEAPPPFHLIRESPSPAIDVNDQVTLRKDWNQVPLYTNTWTNSVPVTIHMNGMKIMRQSIWHEMWYHKQLRSLLMAKAMKDEVGAWDGEGNFLNWETLCKGTDQEVFRDDFGRENTL